MSSPLALYLEDLRQRGLDPVYVLSRRSKVAHLPRSEERCNLDDSNSRELSDHMPPGYRLCQWCQRLIEEQQR